MSRTVVLSILLLAALGCWASSVATEFTNGTAQVERTLPDGRVVKATVTSRAYTQGTLYEAPLWWGAETAPPRSVVSNVQVEVGDHVYFIPLSAFADLANPTDVTISFDDSVQIVIRGGEASTAYEAVLYFGDNTISKRRVFHREFPEDTWEATEYSFKLYD